MNLRPGTLGCTPRVDCMFCFLITSKYYHADEVVSKSVLMTFLLPISQHSRKWRSFEAFVIRAIIMDVKMYVMWKIKSRFVGYQQGLHSLSLLLCPPSV